MFTREQVRAIAAAAGVSEATAKAVLDAAARVGTAPPCQLSFIAEPAPNSNPPPLAGFAEFWIAYPRKTGKPAAERAWRAQRLGAAAVRELLDAIEEHRRSRQWADPQFIPHPATWLNQRRWEDHPAPASEPPVFGRSAEEIRRSEAIRREAIERDMREIRAGGKL